MSDPVTVLTVRRARATSYRPEGGQRYLIQLRAETGDGRIVDSLGWAIPRGLRTGDRSSVSWDFLADCLADLLGRTLSFSGPVEAAGAVQAVLDVFRPRAEERAGELREADREMYAEMARAYGWRSVARPMLKQTAYTVLPWYRSAPFAGTLRGLEAALLDLVCHALELPPDQVVGAKQARELAPNLPQPFGAPDRREEIFAETLQKGARSVAFPPPPAPTYHGRAATQYDEVDYLQPLGSNGTKGHLLEREALALGLSSLRFNKGAFLATDGTRPPLLFKWSRTGRSSAVSLALCTHKEATRLRLARAGVPVPRGRTFAHGDIESAVAFAERIGYPVVVKPATGVRGIGVVANIRNRSELLAAFEQINDPRLGATDFIVEQHIQGRDYRIVVVGDEVIAAILREPAGVEGDGERTVAELVVDKNTFRRQNPHLWGRPILYGSAARYQLRRQGLTLTSVPRKGQRVVLSNTCSLSQGGDSVDVLDELHPSIKDACVRAVKAVPGLWFCGVDFLLEDHTMPLSEQQAGICELNAHAAIGNCEYPLYGSPRQVARTVLRGCVEHFGLSIADKPADQLSLRLTVTGPESWKGYHRWFRRHAGSFGVTGWIRQVDRTTTEVVLSGDTVPVTTLAALAALGPRRSGPYLVSTTHVPPPEVEGFQILSPLTAKD